MSAKALTALAASVSRTGRGGNARSVVWDGCGCCAIVDGGRAAGCREVLRDLPRRWAEKERWVDEEACL